MWITREIAINFYLIVVGAFFLESFFNWKHFKHKKLMAAIVAAFACSWLLLFYAEFVEPKLLVEKIYEVELAQDSKASLRAAVIADFHLGPFKDSHWTEKIAEKVEEAHPDMVFLVGDYVFDSKDQAEGLEPLKELAERYRVIAVTGNHDHRCGGVDEIVDKLESLGITVLRNQHQKIIFSGKELIIAGIDDIWYEGNPYLALKNVSTNDNVVLLSHNPSVLIGPNMEKVDLVISGHTHGGQIKLPFFGPIPELPSLLGQKYDNGLFMYRENNLFITPGVGETGMRTRFLVPPEVSILQIDF